MSHEFHRLRIAHLRRETPDALSLGLTVPDALSDEFRFAPGQHLVVRAMLDGAEVRRTYSISSGAGDRVLWITIKRVEGGLYSPYAHASLKVGDEIEAMPPAGRFVLPPAAAGAPRTLLAIVAGSGITPVMAMLRQALETEPATRFVLIYGNRAYDSIIFREALEDLKDRFLERLMVVHVLSRDADADVPELSGRIDAAKIGRLMSATLDLETVDHAFLCGPDSLIKNARDKLIAMGLPRERIHFEYFRAGTEAISRPVPKVPAARETLTGDAAEVTIVLDGKRHALRVPAGAHVVDTALAAGLRVPYSCKGGMCCTCRAKLVEGRVEMTRNFSLEAWELEAGFVLTCQSKVVTPRAVLDYDQM